MQGESLVTHLTPVPSPDTESDESEPNQGSPAAPTQEKAPAKAAARRGGKLLPSDRISFPRQLDILRGFAVASQDAGGGAVSSSTVGPLIQMSHHTINIATPFYASVGLINRADRGRFTPAQEVVEYGRAQQWSPDTATQRLAPIIRKSWFGQIITRKVSVNDRPQEEILTDLAGAAGADLSNRVQLELLIEFAIAAGIVARNGALLRGVPADGAAVEAQAVAEGIEGPAATPAATPPPTPGVATNFRRDETENVVSFDISVRVKMSEFANWRPERISAFFGGIASVLAAKGRMEEDAGSDGP